jgi:hypothetical protein
MAPEARMEMWSLSRTTSLRLSTPDPQRKPIPAPYTAQRNNSVMGNPALDIKISRAQEDWVLTSSPMDLRHNVVSWDVSRGVALEIAGKNVGHRSRRSTEVYAHFAPDALKRAADARAEAMRVAVEASRVRTGS